MSEEDIEKMREASIASVQGLSAMSMSMVPGEGKDSVYDTMSAVLTVDDPATYLSNDKKSIQGTSELMKGPNGEPLMEVEAADVEIAGVTAVKMTMDMSGMRAMQSQNVEQMKGFFEMMMGEGGKINAYLVTISKGG